MLISVLVAGALADWDPREQSEEKNAVQQTSERFLKEDPSLKLFFEKAYGYAVFPTVGKGAYILGVGYGRGWFYENGQVVGRASITQLSAGAQIGGQAFSEIIFFKDEKQASLFKQGKLELSAQVSAVAVKEGVGKAATYTDGVAVFILPKGGLMAEASISGQRYAFEPIQKQK